MRYVNPEYKNEVMSTGDIMEFSPLDIAENKVSAGSLGFTEGGTGLFGETVTKDTVYIKGTSSADITDLF